MPTNDLDTPFLSSLRTLHAHLALESGAVVRYPGDVAPFLGVADTDADIDGDLDALVAEGESVYLLGAMPEVPRGWTIESFRPLAQMVCEVPIAMIDGPDIIELNTDRHRADVLELTALVYPHYFRPRTMAMGRYYGIYDGSRLAAMIGERLGTHAFREMSAICTHPDFTGRGLAQRLTASLTNDTLSTGRMPFLHVSHDNARAKALYEFMGFRLRRDIGFWSLTRGD